MSRVRLLGITGGIGAGKSYISRLLYQHFGIPVYDCDARAKQLMQTDAELRLQLQALVGPEAYDTEGLNREAMARYVFASPVHAQQVNAIVHPAVRHDFRQWTEIQAKAIDPQHPTPIALESAILYESGFDGEVDEVLFVDAPLPLRIQRTIARSGATPQQVEARIACQQTQASRQRATYVISNDGRPDANLVEQLKHIIQSTTTRKATT